MLLSHGIVLGLIKTGAQNIFGVSGANIEHLHDAIKTVGQHKIRSILCKTETGAAFMADGIFRATGTLGVCCSTSGGGMTNLVSGIAESFQQMIGTLHIIGQPPSTLWGKGAFQDSSGIGHTVDAVQLFSGITKEVIVIDDAKTFWENFEKALTLPLLNRPSPVVMLVARNLFSEPIPNMPITFLEKIKYTHSLKKLSLDDLGIKNKKKPILIVGRELNGKYYDYLSHITFPTCTSITNVGSTKNYSNYLGMIGVAGNPNVSDAINYESDFVIALGSNMALMERALVEKKLLHLKENFVIICQDTVTAKNTFKDAIVYSLSEIDIKFLLSQLQQIDPPNIKHKETTYYFPRATNNSNLTKVPLTQSKAILTIEKYMHEFSYTVLDAGNCASAALHYLDHTKIKNGTIALGMGGMGYSVGASIGAAVGTNERAMAILGDGAFLMQGLECHTAIDLNIPVLFIVFNNAAHGMCESRQNLFFDGRVEACTYKRPKIAQVFKALGDDQVFTFSADSTSQIDDFFAKYLTHKPIPGLLEINIYIEEVPPFAIFLNEDEKIVNKKQLQEALLCQKD